MPKKAKQLIAILALIFIGILLVTFVLSSFVAKPGETRSRFMALLCCIIAIPLLAWILLFCIQHLRDKHSLSDSSQDFTK